MPEFPFKLGADPEFVITMNGFKLAAGETMSAYVKDYQRGSTDEHGNLGTDHNSIAEMRPTAEKDPKKVVEHLGAMISRCAKGMPWSELKTVSVWAPVGGHIHLERMGTPYMQMTDRKRLAVHTALAGFSLPLIMGENHVNQKLRMQGGYGSITDLRVDHAQTVEFRPLTAEWITTPRIAEATLAYMGVVWNELLYHSDHMSEFKEFLPKNQEQLSAIQKLAIDEFGVITQGMLKAMHKAIKKFALYPQFKDQIEFIFDVKAVREEKEKVDYDMIRGWKFSEKKGKIPTKRALFSKKEAKKRIDAINLDLIKNFTKIFSAPSSSAIGINALKDDIAKATAAFNWSLDNRYFLFGLPKGITSPMASNSDGNLIYGKALIKSQRDSSVVEGIFSQAASAFRSHPAFAMKRVDLKSGKSVSDEKHSILLGVPFDTRAKNDPKGVMQAIYAIEKDKIDKGVMYKDIDVPQRTEDDLVSLMEAAATQTPTVTPPPNPMSGTEPSVPSEDRTSIDGLDTPSAESIVEAESSAVEEEDAYTAEDLGITSSPTT